MRKPYLSEITENSDSMARNLGRLLFCAFFAVILVCSIAFLPEIFSAAGRTEYGAFGDFVGGILNPILTFVAFIALLMTIMLQQRELSLARSEFHRTADAMEKENFEATFFRLTSLVRESLTSIDIKYGKQEHSGSDAFRHIHTLFGTRYNERKQEGWHSAYEWIYGRYGHEIAHYFRLLYNAYRYLDEAKSAEGGELYSGLDIDFYARILRAQISDYELVMLHYNAHTNRGSKFQEFIEKYNMNPHHLLDPGHRSLSTQNLAR